MIPFTLFPLFFVAVFAIAIVAIVVSIGAEKKRREALRLLAQRLELRYFPEPDRQMVHSLKYLDRLRQGSNRYVRHVMEGTYRGERVSAFEFHYETHSTDSKGRRSTHHHHLSFFVLYLPRSFPELKIGPEGFFSKLAQSVGYADIDFESHEFSRTFCVRSPDKKFAYDFCNARMIETLMRTPRLQLEIENQVLSISLNHGLKPELVEGELNHLLELRSLMPDYLFEGVPA